MVCWEQESHARGVYNTYRHIAQGNSNGDKKKTDIMIIATEE